MQKRTGAAAMTAAAVAAAFGGGLVVSGGVGDASAAKTAHARHVTLARTLAPRAVAHAATSTVKQTFMNIPGVPGDVGNAIPAFKGQIAVSSYTTGATIATSVAGGGGSVSRPTFKDVTVTYNADRSLPLLEHDAYAGTHLASVTLTEVDSTGAALRTVTLTNAAITGIGTATAAPGNNVVTVSFSYGQFTTQLAALDANGNPIRTCWSVQTNASC